MRMFLVGTCDIFLILYLSTLASVGRGTVDAEMVSSLTVQDYFVLEEEKESQIAEAEAKLTELEERIAEREEEFESERSRLEEEASEQRSAAASQIERAENERDRMLAELRDARVTYTAAQEQLETIQKDLEGVRASWKESEEATKDLEDELESAKRAVSEAETRARTAESERASAIEEVEKIRVENRRIEREIEQKQELITEVTQSAEEARSNLRAAEEEVRAIKQPARNVYTDQISHARVPVEVWEEQGVDSNLWKLQARFQALAVRLTPRMSAVLAPSESLDLGSETNEAAVRDLRFIVGKRRASYLITHPRYPELVGIVVEDSLPGAVEAQAIASSEISSLMPILLAVRVKEPVGLSDRIRGVESNFYPFQRDRLQPIGANLLEFRVEGFRGTGDFAATILPGDQIVDLNGSLIGVAIERNRIALTGDLLDWPTISLNYSPPRRSR